MFTPSRNLVLGIQRAEFNKSISYLREYPLKLNRETQAELAASPNSTSIAIAPPAL